MTSSTHNGSVAKNAKVPNESLAAGAGGSDSKSEYFDAFSCGYTYVNPFTHRVQIDNGFDLAKIYVLTIILVPLRAVGCVISLLTAWMFACIGLYGVSLEDLKAKPLDGWRKKVKTIVASSMRMVYASGSFQYITFKGERASSKEAPVLVVAPHSSYVDSIVVVSCGPPSIVAKQETSFMPLLGKIINYSQPIYVQREDPNSRVNTIREIIDRARSHQEWPQVAIFPEGTCTNRSALIRFKPGAFYPGVPVQPVLIKYPNKYDTCTWTWDGPGVLRLLWLSMASFYSKCEIEFLPVYTPNEEEKKDANLFANNVRKVMADALGVPTSEYSFDDVVAMDRGKHWKIPYTGDFVEIERKLHSLGLLQSDKSEELISNFHKIPRIDKLDGYTFAKLNDVDCNDTNFHHLCSLLDPNCCGSVNLRNYLILLTFCKMLNEEHIKFLKTIAPLYSDQYGKMSREDFRCLTRHTGKIEPDKSDQLFFAIDYQNKGLINFDDFEKHVRDLPQYKYLYKKLEKVRRNF